MEINTETNLPVLPKGYWWRIEHYEHPYADFLRVSVVGVRHKSRWWTDKPHPTKTEEYRLTYRSEYWSDYLRNPEKIINEMVKDLYDAVQDVIKRKHNEKFAESLLGDYPPKVFPN